MNHLNKPAAQHTPQQQVCAIQVPVGGLEIDETIFEDNAIVLPPIIANAADMIDSGKLEVRKGGVVQTATQIRALI